MRTILPLILMLILGRGYSIEIDESDYLALDKFFKTLFWESEGGYVYFKKKPICINGYFFEDLERLGTSSHFHSVVYREGINSFRKFSSFNNLPCRLHVYDVPDSLVKNCHHFLFLRQDQVIDVIEKNLSLFQYLLGPTITPNELYSELTSSSKPFHQTLKNNKALIGILLGFGVENSLIVSRVENIHESMFLCEAPPKLPHFQRSYMDDKIQLELLLFYSTPEIDDSLTNMNPSLGFSNLNEEANHLTSLVEVSSEKLTEPPAFVFGKIKNKDNDLILDLESTQDQIRDLVKNEECTKIVLFEMFGEPIVIKKNNQQLLPLSVDEIQMLPHIIAKSICKLIADEKSANVDAFIQGMKDAEMQMNTKNKNIPDINKFRLLHNLKNKIDLANNKFKRLKHENIYHELLPEKLYMRILREGTGKTLRNESLIKAKYKIIEDNGKVLVDNFILGVSLDLDLSDVISGLAYGVEGMKCGEIREIYIHPSLGYGIYTTLTKAEPLKVLIELEQIYEHQPKLLPNHKILDLSLPLPSDFDDDFQNQMHEYFYQKGQSVWSHFHLSQDYTLTAVIANIKSIRNNNGNFLLSETESNVINRLHWNLYRLAGKI